ncbi:MAG: porin family protein [bacterium]|nr:porin family protein [bacterium]
MHARRILLLGLLLGLGVGSNAWAQDEDDHEGPDYARQGWYLGASGVFVSEQWTGSLDDVNPDDVYGFSLRAGHRVSPWAGVEIEFEWMDDFFPDERMDFSAIAASVNTHVYPFGGKLGRIQPYGLAGLGIVSTIVDHRDRATELKQSNADWGFRVGGGIDLYYTEHIATSIKAAYVWTVGDVKDIDHVSIGVGILYRF